MKITQLKSHDIHYNLAAEEHLFSKPADVFPFFLLWQNEDAVVIGKHQNTVEEVNLDFTSRNAIPVARRISGGGAVYHDLGNFNYSIIVHSEAMHWDIKRMADPVVAALRRIGVNVQVNERNDLLILGRKISGSSQYIRRNRLLHHGTLLFHSDLELLSKTLRPPHDQIVSRSKKSMRSPVTNICHHYPDLMMADFITSLKAVLSETTDLEEFAFSRQDQQAIAKLKAEKYATWEWIYARSPEYSISKQRKLNGRELKIEMVVKNGEIQSMHFESDIAHENRFLEDMGNNLVGVKLREEDVAGAIQRLTLDKSVSGFSSRDLAQALIY